jgi:hypothetical protein
MGVQDIVFDQPDNAHHVRLAKNEARFRDINERLARDLRRMRRRAGPVERFVCECSRPDCTQMIEVALDAYAQVRTDPRHFVVKRGHALGEIEFVVRQETTHDVVEKRAGRPAAIAEQESARRAA